VTSTYTSTHNGTPTVVVETEWVIETPPSQTAPEGTLQTDNAAPGSRDRRKMLGALVGAVMGAAILV
jgi:hypothetical protein